MSTIAFSRFPAEERTRVERVLSAASLHPDDVLITKTIFAPGLPPGPVHEMITIVHGPVSLTYTSEAGGGWIDPFSADLATGALDRLRERETAGPESEPGSPGSTVPDAANDSAPAPGGTRLIARADLRADDLQVLQAIAGLPERRVERRVLFRAVILNELGQAYREVDLYGLLDSVSLTAAMNALGFRIDALKREGRSRRYDWSFSREAGGGSAGAK